MYFLRNFESFGMCHYTEKSEKIPRDVESILVHMRFFPGKMIFCCGLFSFLRSFKAYKNRFKVVFEIENIRRKKI